MSSFRFSTEIRVRLPEIDAAGVVYHGVFFTYFEVARSEYLKALGLPDVWKAPGVPTLIVHAEADFASPARFDDLLRVEARIAGIGRTSFTFEYRVAGERPVAAGRTVHVTVDPATWKPVPVPDGFRARIDAFEKG